MPPSKRSFVASIAFLSVALVVINCNAPPREERVKAVYDKETGKLHQLTVDARKDGKPNILSDMDGKKIIRIEVDHDEDGKVDRWEYYGDDQKIFKVGLSRANDGKTDTWAFRSPGGVLTKLEVSTRRDGRFNRTQFYENGALIRIEEDTDGDDKVDKWETYRDGALANVAFDPAGSGHPTVSIDYPRGKARSDR
jgi:hypothetical protein